jgi:hypothetical protein
MVDRDALLRLAQALPDGTAVPVPVAWLCELLAGAETARTAPALPEMDLTLEEAGVVLHRSPVTVRGWCNTGLIEGAYRLRHRQWRIPRGALRAFQAAELKAHQANGKKCRRGVRPV